MRMSISLPDGLRSVGVWFPSRKSHAREKEQLWIIFLLNRESGKSDLEGGETLRDSRQDDSMLDRNSGVLPMASLLSESNANNELHHSHQMIPKCAMSLVFTSRLQIDKAAERLSGRVDKFMNFSYIQSRTILNTNLAFSAFASIGHKV